MDHPAQTAYTPEETGELAILREKALERVGDEAIYREIAHYFANNLSNSLEALARALADADLENAARLAHSLKGNCATVGAEGMRACWAGLEKLCRAGDLPTAQAHYDATAPKMLALRGELLAL